MPKNRDSLTSEQLERMDDMKSVESPEARLQSFQEEYKNLTEEYQANRHGANGRWERGQDLGDQIEGERFVQIGDSAAEALYGDWDKQARRKNEAQVDMKNPYQNEQVGRATKILRLFNKETGSKGALNPEEINSEIKKFLEVQLQHFRDTLEERMKDAAEALHAEYKDKYKDKDVDSLPYEKKEIAERTVQQWIESLRPRAERALEQINVVLSPQTNFSAQEVAGRMYKAERAVKAWGSPGYIMKIDQYKKPEQEEK